MCATLVCEIRGGLTALNAREFGSTPNLDDAEGVLSPRMDTWMHWRLDRRVLTVNWSDAMEAGMLELHRGPIPGR